jgi:hypothetical protein
MTPLEKMARAMFPTVFDDNRGWQATQTERRQTAINKAKAALLALREPTTAMIDAAEDVDEVGRAEGTRIGRYGAIKCWVNMIDAALGETE